MVGQTFDERARGRQGAGRRWIRPAMRTLRLLFLIPAITVASEPSGVGALEARVTAITDQLRRLPVMPPPQPVTRVGFHSAFVNTTLAARWVQVDLGAVRDFDSVVVVPAFLASAENESGAYGFPPRFRVDVSDDPEFGSYQTITDHTESDFHVGTSPIFIPAKTRARHVRFTATRLAEQRLGRGCFCLGEIFVFGGMLNVAAGCPVSSSGAYETLPAWSPGHVTDGLTHLGAPIQESTRRSNGWHSGVANSPEKPKWVQVDFGSSQALDEVRLYPAHPPDFPERAGFGFPARFRVEISVDPAFAQPTTLLDASSADFANPGDNPVVIPAKGLPGRFVRVTATSLWERSSDYVFALAELQAFARERNVASGGAVSSLDETRTGAWSGAMLVDGQTSLGAIVPWPLWLEQLSQRHALTGELAMIQQRLAEHRVRRQGMWFRIAGGGVLAAILFALLLQRRQKQRQRQALIDLRRQIARDLHDEIGSSLGSIALMSELAMREDGSGALHEIHRLSLEASESMRGIVWLVREPGMPTIERLVETMRQTAARLPGCMTWELRVPPDPAPPAPSLDFHRHVFLFFKEAIHNIARHARAKSVRIEVTWAPSTFTLTLHDDGIGFDAAYVSSGCGLENLRHRAAALGGQVDISSTAGEGTRIHLAVPLHRK